MISSGKRILVAADDTSQELVGGDSLVVPEGFSGNWNVLGAGISDARQIVLPPPNWRAKSDEVT